MVYFVHNFASYFTGTFIENLSVFALLHVGELLSMLWTGSEDLNWRDFAPLALLTAVMVSAVCGSCLATSNHPAYIYKDNVGIFPATWEKLTLLGGIQDDTAV